MAGNDRRNRPCDAKLKEALAGGATYMQAASRAGCSERTARRRMADPAFRVEVDRLRRDMLDRSLGRLADGAAEASATLRELLSASSERVRLGAARALIDSYVRILATADFERRIAALETGTASMGSD